MAQLDPRAEYETALCTAVLTIEQLQQGMVAFHPVTAPAGMSSLEAELTKVLVSIPSQPKFINRLGKSIGIAGGYKTSPSFYVGLGREVGTSLVVNLKQFGWSVIPCSKQCFSLHKKLSRVFVYCELMALKVDVPLNPSGLKVETHMAVVETSREPHIPISDSNLFDLENGI